MGNIGKYFDRHEFACKCGCGFDMISLQLIKILDTIRDNIGMPIKITSGCRCAARNKAVGGEPNSAHMRGTAVDVQCPDSHFRFMFEKHAFAAGIRRMGEYKNTPTMIHIDVDTENPQDVKWLNS